MELRQSVEQISFNKILLQTIRMAHIRWNGWLCKDSGQHKLILYQYMPYQVTLVFVFDLLLVSTCDPMRLL